MQSNQNSAPHDAAAAPSIVLRTMQTARRATALALVGSLVIVAAVMAERHWHGRASERAAQRLHDAERAAGAVLLADERLTMSAYAAAVSGESRWVDRYERYLPSIDNAIERAAALAPTEVGRRFDDETRVANNRLVELERASIAARATGDAAQARALLDGNAYAVHKRTLSQGTERFLAGMLDALRAEQRTIHNRAAAFGLLLVLVALLGAAAIWHRLSLSLARSRDFFVSAERRIQHLAANDALTGLANRAALHETMAQWIARRQREGGHFALLMIDLDRFKPINDTHGHLAGDRVLQEVALRLARTLRASAPRARFGGDEFVVLLDGEPDSVLQAVAERVLRVLAEPIAIDGVSLQLGASIGIARFPQDATSEDELLRKADLALYRAKQDGRAQARLYDPALETPLIERDAQTQRLREAIRDGEIVPHYQPIVALDTGHVGGVELLARWQHPQRGLLAPAEFIALAESTGQLGALTSSVLRQACADLKRFPTHWRLALNIAPYQIQDESLVPQILAVLHEAGIAAERLEIELTETALVSDIVAARRVIGALRAAGMTVALDDFGTGHSSLSYLTEFTFDKIKIDRSFVCSLHERGESAKIVSAIVGLSRSLGAQTVAEGVESAHDADVLSALGCASAQGYYFARPMAADTLQARYATPVTARERAPAAPVEPRAP